MQLVIEFDIPKELKERGVKAIFYEGRKTIVVNYKSWLIRFVIYKKDRFRTLQGFGKFGRNVPIDAATRDAVRTYVASNWELFLSCRTEVPIEVLERESMELNQQEYLERLDRFSRFNPNPITSSVPLKSSKSDMFGTYVVIKVNRIKKGVV